MPNDSIKNMDFCKEYSFREPSAFAFVHKHRTALYGHKVGFLACNLIDKNTLLAYNLTCAETRRGGRMLPLLMWAGAFAFTYKVLTIQS